MFWKKLIFEDPLLGQLTWSRGHWLTASLPSTEGEVTLSVAGDEKRPNYRALERAKSILSQPTAAVAAAKSYVLVDRDASEFCRGNGVLVLDGFSVSNEGELRVELALSDWPDAMITVILSDKMIPCKVLLAD